MKKETYKAMVDRVGRGYDSIREDLRDGFISLDEAKLLKWYVEGQHKMLKWIREYEGVEIILD